MTNKSSTITVANENTTTLQKGQTATWITMRRTIKEESGMVITIIMHIAEGMSMIIIRLSKATWIIKTMSKKKMITHRKSVLIGRPAILKKLN